MGLFSYLILSEVNKLLNKHSKYAKDDIYYNVYLIIIIYLNIISGIFRLFGSILSFIYIKTSKKILKCN